MKSKTVASEYPISRKELLKFPSFQKTIALHSITRDNYITCILLCVVQYICMGTKTELTKESKTQIFIAYYVLPTVPSFCYLAVMCFYHLPTQDSNFKLYVSVYIITLVNRVNNKMLAVVYCCVFSFFLIPSGFLSFFCTTVQPSPSLILGWLQVVIHQQETTQKHSQQ